MATENKTLDFSNNWIPHPRGIRKWKYIEYWKNEVTRAKISIKKKTNHYDQIINKLSETRLNYG